MMMMIISVSCTNVFSGRAHVVFEEREKREYSEKSLLEQSREPENFTHM